jgi:hypothetical protein
MTDELFIHPAMTQPYVIMAVVDGEDGQTEHPLGRRDGYEDAEGYRREMIGLHAADLLFVTAYLLPAHPGTVELTIAPDCAVSGASGRKLWFSAIRRDLQGGTR